MYYGCEGKVSLCGVRGFTVGGVVNIVGIDGVGFDVESPVFGF